MREHTRNIMFQATSFLLSHDYVKAEELFKSVADAPYDLFHLAVAWYALGEINHYVHKDLHKASIYYWFTVDQSHYPSPAAYALLQLAILDQEYYNTSKPSNDYELRLEEQAPPVVSLRTLDKESDLIHRDAQDAFVSGVISHISKERFRWIADPLLRRGLNQVSHDLLEARKCLFLGCLHAQVPKELLKCFLQTPFLTLEDDRESMVSIVKQRIFLLNGFLNYLFSLRLMMHENLLEPIVLQKRERIESNFNESIPASISQMCALVRVRLGGTRYRYGSLNDWLPMSYLYYCYAMEYKKKNRTCFLAACAQLLGMKRYLNQTSERELLFKLMKIKNFERLSWPY